MIDEIIVVLIVFSSLVALPTLLFWLRMRTKKLEINKRSEILLAALEKNPDMNMEEFVRGMNPPEKKIKQKLLRELMCGLIFIAIGLSKLIISFFKLNKDAGDLHVAIDVAGVLCTCIGLAILVAFFVGKRMLAKEIEAEEAELLKKLTANSL